MSWSAALVANVPSRALGRSTGEISVAAHRVIAARHAVAARRAKLPDCDFDGDADAAVTSAYDDVRTARDESARSVIRRDWLLTAGNSCGAGLFVGAVALLVRGVDPMAPVIAGLLGGAAVAVTAGLVSAAVVTRRARLVLSTALAIWYDAMEAAGVATMGELHARRLRHHGCARAAMEVEAAEAVEAQAEAEWRRLVGDSWKPDDVAALLRHLATLRFNVLTALAACLGGLIDTVSAPDAEVIELPVTTSRNDSRTAQAG